MVEFEAILLARIEEINNALEQMRVNFQAASARLTEAQHLLEVYKEKAKKPARKKK